MSIRTREWYLNTIDREEKEIERQQEAISDYLRAGRNDEAVKACQRLQTAILSLDTCQRKLEELDD